MACLDTSTLLDLSGRARIRARVQRQIRALRDRGETLATTRFNVADLWVGIQRSLEPRVELRRVQSLIRPLVVLDFDQRAAEIFGRVVGHLQEAGSPIGDMDALIASVCMVSRHSILTRNRVHFSRVPGLVVETY